MSFSKRVYRGYCSTCGIGNIPVTLFRLDIHGNTDCDYSNDGYLGICDTCAGIIKAGIPAPCERLVPWPTCKGSVARGL